MPDLLKQHTESQKVDTSVYQTAPKKKKSSLLWRSVVGLLLVIIFIGIGFLTKTVLAINSTNDASGEKIGFFEQIKHLIINPEDELKGESDDRINILLAGIGGAGHQGAYLADTIIVASLKPSTHDVAMLSIPRDLYVEIPEFGWRKINNAMAFGTTSDYPGGGEALLAEVVEDVTGLPIHYYARIDFEGFRKIIDDAGGLDIYVEQSFTDYQYPDYNFGYQPISFKEGPDHMNGERALQYVRSRHGTNGEGSDFARSKRQQNVLLALKEELLSSSALINPSRILAALDDLGDHNQTNLEIWELVELSKFVKEINGTNIITEVLETGVKGELYSDTTIDGAYILRPKGDTFAGIQYIAENIFNASRITKEMANIEIQNSTGISGLASSTAERLKGMHYNITKVGNASLSEELNITTIYDLSDGSKPYTLISLKNVLGAVISPKLPAFMLSGQELTYDSIAGTNKNTNVAASGENIDILVVVGNDLSPTPQLSTTLLLQPLRHF